MAGTLLDVFKSNDAFSLMSLTDAINKKPYVPGRVGRLGIFRQSGIATLTAMLEEKEGQLALLMTKPRGAVPDQDSPSKRTASSLTIPHIPINDFVQADEIQGVREFGTTDQAQTIQGIVSDRLGTIASKLDATLEHLRVGAIKGIILDGDGSTQIYNLFTEFGVTQYDEINFDLANSKPANGALRKKCHEVTRKTEDVLGAATYNHIHCFCGSDFFDDLVSHSEATKAYERWKEGEMLRADLARKTFQYAGILFEEYRGKVNNPSGVSVEFVGTDNAYFFPVGVDGLFREYYAPANYIETVNTIGLPRYAKTYVNQSETGVVVECQMNPLPICTRPKVLLKGKRTAEAQSA